MLFGVHPETAVSGFPLSVAELLWMTGKRSAVSLLFSAKGYNQKMAESFIQNQPIFL